MHIQDLSTGLIRVRKLRRRFDKVRMPRELTFSCYQRFKFMERSRCRIWFREALEAVRRECPIDIWAYVLMPEHVHMIVAPRKAGIKVGHFAGRIKEKVSRQAVHWLADNSPKWLAKIAVREGDVTRHRFWQPGGGYDRNIEEADTLLNMIEYIHQNPVRRGLVSNAEDWEWSSARWYEGIKPAWIEMDSSIREALV